MASLGHERFSVVGHDRGSLYAFRLALDHPTTITKVALLDCLPVSEHLDRINARFATAWWHWFFFAQPEMPERVINSDPESWYRGDPNLMGHQATMRSGALCCATRGWSGACWRTTAPD